MSDPRDAADVGPARHAADAGDATDPTSQKKKHTRWLYARVLIVQVVTLIALYWLQAAYG